jgi:hypothetical protein
MNTILEPILYLGVLTWLTIISWIDIRHRELQSIWWTGIPFTLAIFWSIIQGNYGYAIFAGILLGTSERSLLAEHLHCIRLKSVVLWLPLILGGFVLFPNRWSPIILAALAFFWIAWEFKAWGGADAMTAMTLVLFFPFIELIALLLGVNLLVALAHTVYSLIRSQKLAQHAVPGLPLMAAALLCFGVVTFELGLSFPGLK